MAQEYVLEMRNISKSFPGVKALDNVTLKIRPGTVHALMGENGAGKSTLMKCLFGIYVPDAGEVILEGKKVQFRNPREALDHGISMIHQELNPVPYRSVMENIWLGRFPVRQIMGVKVVDHKKMYNDTKALMEELKIDIKPDTLVAKLSVSQIQMIEIAKAISCKAKVIVMDEPTSSLTENEVKHLFEIINNLRKQGIAIIYISHKMEEILEISDEVTIMRDGQYVGTWPASQLSIDMIISKMVGRDLTNRFPIRQNTPGDVIMRVEDFTAADPKSFKNVTFELRRGEILGIGGLVGAQRTELVEAIFGLRSISSGKIFISGKEVKIRNPIDAKRHGIALLTEDRRNTGIFPVLSVEDNALISSIDNYIDYKFVLNQRRAINDIRSFIDRLQVKTPSLKTAIQFLSGGNQQKVIFARWLLNNPDILIFDEPTRGIDVGAKYEIYKIIADLAKQGKSIIMISSEMPELLGMSDRIMVMCAGRVSGIVDGREATQELIMKYATQFVA
ncbi:methyl-galactoside transport system ATP-binding protein [Caldanaerobius fijiensis DSM 17918]|uniref:Ribose/galactose/methyl galactoside import ATP-binding protein n=1 Tax=Caldanaerobius fijiensis DSM 17918 TaxID=1121256 RepID=A0A1M5BE96_9THEO|nr:sugar ABC transporter ATP-binding protein [Caldanaerobius fijiensis]SHF40814.1 methyl-galactoside transport system ATP-binding protein [Caldanaerobius fijiensis DSM 17918]